MSIRNGVYCWLAVLWSAAACAPPRHIAAVEEVAGAELGSVLDAGHDETTDLEDSPPTPLSAADGIADGSPTWVDALLTPTDVVATTPDGDGGTDAGPEVGCDFDADCPGGPWLATFPVAAPKTVTAVVLDDGFALIDGGEMVPAASGLGIDFVGGKRLWRTDAGGAVLWQKAQGALMPVLAQYYPYGTDQTRGWTVLASAGAHVLAGEEEQAIVANSPPMAFVILGEFDEQGAIIVAGTVCDGIYFSGLRSLATAPAGWFLTCTTSGPSDSEAFVAASAGKWNPQKANKALSDIVSIALQLPAMQAIVHATVDWMWMESEQFVPQWALNKIDGSILAGTPTDLWFQFGMIQATNQYLQSVWLAAVTLQGTPVWLHTFPNANLRHLIPGPAGSVWLRGTYADPGEATPVARLVRIDADGHIEDVRDLALDAKWFHDLPNDRLAMAGIAPDHIWLAVTDPWGHASLADSGVCWTTKPATCDDNNACTRDGCDGKTGCTHTARPDGAPCTGGKLCKKGLCDG